MPCRTPGCAAANTNHQNNGQTVLYCDACGWPLGEGHPSTDVETLVLQGDAPATFQVRMENAGSGSLKWKILDLPEGVTLNTRPPVVPPWSSEEVSLLVSPTALADDRTLTFTCRTWDRVGLSGFDFRLTPPDEWFIDRTLTLDVRRQQHGPLEVPWHTLLFGSNVTSARFSAVNKGETVLEVIAEATDGYQLSATGIPRQSSIRTQLHPGTSWSVMVWAPLRDARGGTVKVTAPRLPEQRVDLVPLHVEPLAPPKEQWIVAIDFGTSKSAVMLLDQHAEGAEPLPVMWKHHGMEYPYLPSVVRFEQNQPKAFGWEIPYTAAGPNIIRSLKMLLSENDPRVRKAIVFFLRQLLKQADKQFPGVLTDASIVCTLPALDGPTSPTYQEQRALTLEFLAEAATPYGLSREKISFYAEPECAAIDFLHTLQEQSNTGNTPSVIRPNDWLCVLDMGGGTTDVTFAKFSTQGASPSFDVMESIGFRNYAGDRIDADLYAHCIERWQRGQRIARIPDCTKPIDTLAPKEIADASEIYLKGEDDSQALQRDNAIENLRNYKETMYRTAPPADQVWDEFAITANHIQLTNSGLANIFLMMSQDMFYNGTQRGEISVRQKAEDLLEERGMTEAQIRFLCLTGGTSNIPVFETHFSEALGIADHVVPLKSDDPTARRLNVVKGAARRPGLRLRGQLPVSVSLKVPGETKEVLAHGTVPGCEIPSKVPLQPQASSHLEVLAQEKNGTSHCLFAFDVTNDKHNIRFLSVRLAYSLTGHLSVQAEWMAADPVPVLIKTELQQIPAAM